MKKLFVTLLAVLLIFSITACSKPADKPDDSTPATSPAGPETDKTPGTSGNPGTEPIVVTEAPATEPPETEPPVLEVPAGGYCAVGEVDAANSRAAILFANGLVKTMTYVGEAPKAGTVMYFETEDDKIALAAFEFEDYSSWRIYNDANGDFFYGNDGVNEYRLFFSDNCAGFVRFSETEWSAYQGKDFLYVAASIGDYENTAWPCNLLACSEGDPSTIFAVYTDGHIYYDNGVDPLCLFTPDGFALEHGAYQVVLSDGE